MIIKIKDIARKGISLVLALAMMMPTGAFAGTYNVNNWDGYRESLRNDIMKQETNIIINFNGSETFTSEYSARLKIEGVYKEVLEDIPKHFGELNIIEKTTLPVLTGTSNTPLKSVTHTIKYNNSAVDFAEINTMLIKEYNTIKTKVTDYEKIKAAYDYMVGALSNVDGIKVPRIKELLSKQGSNAHAVLFAMMMTELGYDNDIATRQDGTKWNIVKVQGLWYHVDGRFEDIEGNVVRDNQFLTSKEDYTAYWDSDIRKDENEKFSSVKYNGNPPTVPQLKYEIELIQEEIDNMSKKLENIFDGISIEQISEVKNKINVIKEKVKSYEEIISILRAEVNKIGDEALKSELSESLDDLINIRIIDISTKINEKEAIIVDLENALKAVVKAETTKFGVDIDAAFIAVGAVVEDGNIVNLKTSLMSRLNAINTEIAAKAAVEKAEKALKENKSIDEIEIEITNAMTAIDKVINVSIRTQFLDRISAMEIAKDAIESVNAVEGIITTFTTVPEELENIIKEAELAVKTAELKVKDIKDTVVKANQLYRIKEIKLVVASLKAVYKAETTKPLKMTYVTSARTAIDKLNAIYQTEINTLRARLDKVQIAIMLSDSVLKAEKAVEKAEKYMKDLDIALAREAVEVLKLLEKSDALDAKIKELEYRIDATDKVAKVEVSLLKYLKEYTESNKIDLQTAMDNANAAIDKLNDGIIKIQRINRMKVIENARFAAELVEGVKNNNGTVQAAKEAIANISDSKIKTELVNKLNYILSQQEKEKNQNDATVAIEAAKKSLETIDTTSIENIEAVSIAQERVSKLPTGTFKTGLQTTLKELNSAIKAKQIVENAEIKMKNTTLTEKDVIAAEKAVLNIESIYKPGLDTRVMVLRTKFEEKVAANLLSKAEEAVKKAKETRTTTDISAAKKAILLVKDLLEKAKLTAEIELLEVQIAKDSMRYAETTRVLADITSAKKAIAAVSTTEEYKDLSARVKAMESYIATIKVLQNAEKYRNLENEIAAKTALVDFKEVVEKVKDGDKAVYIEMITDIEGRIEKIGNYLADETKKVTLAETAVKNAEEVMKVDSEPDSILIQTAQGLVNIVTDKTLRAGLQKRIDAIQIAKDAKAAVTGAEAYLNEKSVKEAETALSKVDRTKYLEIVTNLSGRIAALRNKLDISKKVTEAINLVQKAVDSRISSDSIKARFAVDALKGIELAKDSYERMTIILNELDDSIKNEATDQTTALAAANLAIKKAFEIINETTTYIAQIIEGQEIIIDGNGEKINKIQEAYKKIESAKIEVIIANAAVRRLTEQKDLLDEINGANKEIELAEDNIDVKEAVRLTTIASSFVLKANDEQTKSEARLAIAAARRAVDKIGHNNNKALKTTILNTVNSIEKKLTSDNDQELIDLAVKAVNDAAGLLADAVRYNQVKLKQEEIDKAIFAAKMAIGWISDNNKAAKATLTGFLNDIEAMLRAEIAGIDNEVRINNAETAVAEAESLKGKEGLDGAIRSARLRVNIIINDGPDTKVIIDDLNTRLDILEGKTGGSGGNGKPGGGNNSGGNKPGGDTTPINVIPTTPLPDSKRVISTTEPVWGKTKELKKTNPTAGASIQDITVFRVNESKIKTIELSNVLTTKSSENATLVVRGKNIKLDSKPYINDKINNSILLPIKTLGDELGFTVSLIDSPVSNGAKRLLINGFVYGVSKSIIMDIGSEYCYVNGNLVKMSSKPAIQDGRTYIPVDFMVEHLGLSFSYYNQNGNIQLIIN